MALCPQCGAARVNRYCAQCGSAVVAANCDLQSISLPKQRNRSAKSKKPSWLIVLLPLTLAMLGYFRLSAYSVRSLPPMAPAIRSLDPVENFPVAHFEQGRAAIRMLENRMLSLRDDVDRLSTERGDVLNLRQHLLQARLQADYEGRWPTKAAGRLLDRAQLKDSIDKSERWLSECNRAMIAATDQLHRLGISAGEAERLLLQMERRAGELDRGVSQGHWINDQAFIQEERRAFERLGRDFKAVVNDPNIRAARITLRPFDLDAVQ